MQKISLKELSKENKLFLNTDGLIPLNALVLSNITVGSSEVPIKNIFFNVGFDVKITYGNYNNLINESLLSKNYDLTIIIWELGNIIEDFFFKYFSFSELEKETLIQRIKSEIDLVYANIAKAPISIITKFTANHFYNKSIASHAFEDTVNELNEYLIEAKPIATTLIDVDNIYTNLGVEASIDLKMFNLFKSLYTTEFYFHFAKLLSPVVCRNKGRIKKVLILDCDNTLWRGIIGEDGFDGIEMSYNTKRGASFARVQSLIKGLHKRGVLLCICSKNNFNDVQNVLENHPDMLLRTEDFVIQKVNWYSKAENIKEIATELNLGLDSFVFVDDSDFEVNLVKEQLAAVKVYQVPKKLHLYPKLFIELLNDFYNPVLTKEDISKTKAYKQEFKRKRLKSKSSNNKEYLSSLGLVLECKSNSLTDIIRISQMTQKTNQFNFTTKRYSVAEIEQFMKSGRHEVLSYTVKDKYGDYGITALVILEHRSREMLIDTFLMSCRIIGRDLELSIIDSVFEYLDSRNYDKIILKLVHTKKNIVVNEFGEKFGFSLVEESDDYKLYDKLIKEYTPFNLSYISRKSVLVKN